jgi:hypothetical protein
LDPLPSTKATRIIRHTDVAHDPIYIRQGHVASYYDAECTVAPNRILPWVLPTEETRPPFDGSHDIAPDIIYARGVPYTSDPGLTSFDKKLCTLIQFEIGFFRDLGCDKKHSEKTEKYTPLAAALKQY